MSSDGHGHGAAGESRAAAGGAGRVLFSSRISAAGSCGGFVRLSRRESAPCCPSPAGVAQAVAGRATAEKGCVPAERVIHGACGALWRAGAGEGGSLGRRG